MKQTTIFDYISKVSKKTRETPLTSFKNNEKNIIQNEVLINSYIQKNLSQLILEEEEFYKIKDLLGDSWHRQENGFGLTDKDNIMIFSTIRDFNNNFFNLYKLEDFDLLKKINLKIEDLKEDKNLYLTFNGIEYNSYYIFKAYQILGEKSKIYQHHKLKLLFLINSKYAALVCPKF